jgi:peptide/nickel transport system substrate-binding protein
MTMSITRTLMAGLAAIALTAGAAHAQTTLRIGLAEDPDALDPTTARTFVGRIVFASLCDKLFDIDDKLNIVPQLATGYSWGGEGKELTIKLRDGVTFHDGEKMDAEAVRFSLDRHLNMQGSFRRSEISALQKIDVVDPLTVKLTLSAPFAPFVAQLTDRAGMIVSPKAAQAAGAQFAAKPVCAGPFRFVERVAQDRIVVEKFPQYWDAGKIGVDRVVYLPIPDHSVRFANLQGNALDLIERLQPTDIPAVRRNQRLKLSAVEELGYMGMWLNVANGEKANSPIGKDRRVREAFELAIDRATIVQVVYNGEYTPTVQAIPPASPFANKAAKIPARNVERAKALLREAGFTAPVVVNLMVANSPDFRQVGEVIQSMARESGFDVRLQATEFASALQAAARGDFEAFLVGWSGRSDPDGNIYSFATCKGGQNDGRYCDAEVDRLLDEARAVPDAAARIAIYRKVAALYLERDRGRIYLWHRKNLFAHAARLQGLRLVPDGLIRPQGIRLQ